MPRRLRLILKWTGFAISLAVFTLFFASLRTNFGYGSNPYTYTFSRGALVRAKWPPGVAPVGWYVETVKRDRLLVVWRPQFTGGSQRILPLWIPFTVATLPTFALFIRDRRRTGKCRSCGYDLTANTSGTCPECGEAI